MTTEKKKEYYRQYYKLHKAEIDARNKKWREENKEKFYNCVYAYRKRKAKELKEKGIKFNWLSENGRKQKNAERDTTTD